MNQQFIRELLDFGRVCFISGGRGSGKTLLATAIAEHLMRNLGYRVFCNYPCALNSELSSSDLVFADGQGHPLKKNFASF